MKRVEEIFGFLLYYQSFLIKFRVELLDYSVYKPMKTDWKYVYGDFKEELPSKMLEPKGKPVIITGFGDANLYHDLTTEEQSWLALLCSTRHQLTGQASIKQLLRPQHVDWRWLHPRWQ